MLLKKLFKIVGWILIFLIGCFGLVKISILINFKCIYQELFHISCFGCGFSRMILSILRFDIYQAFRYNPLCFLLIIIGIIFGIIDIIYYLLKDKLIKIPKSVIIILVIIIFIYMILRNIPGFEFLLPTEI